MITLTLASGTGIKGGTITLNVAIASTGGDQCSVVEFTVTHTSDVAIASATLGASGTAASKTLSRGGDTLVVWGSNVNVIGDGQLVAITFQIAANPSTGSIPISITAISASDPNAIALTTSGVSGTITIDTPVVACPIGGSTAVISTPYSATLIVSGGTPPYTWSIIG